MVAVFLSMGPAGGAARPTEERLRALGHEVVRADSLAVAEEALESRPLAAVIWTAKPGALDSQALGELCRRARQASRAPVPVLVLVVGERVEEPAVASAKAAGATVALSLPSDQAAFEGMITLLAAQAEPAEERHGHEGRAQEVEATRQHLHSVFMQAPAPICLLLGSKHRFVLANPPYLELVGRKDVIGLTVAEALPEVTDQGFIDLLDGVYSTGVAFVGRDVTIQLDRKGTGELETRHLSFVYEPYRDARGMVTGIFVMATDITEMIAGRKALEEGNRRSEFLVRAATVLSRRLHLETMAQELADLIVAEVADFCSLIYVSTAGDVQRLGAAPPHLFPPEMQSTTPRHLSQYPPGYPVHDLLATGKTWTSDGPADFLTHAGAQASDHDAALRRMGLKQIISVPMITGGRTLGALSAGMIDSGRRFDAEHVALFEALARQAALTIDNALLYAEAQQERARAEEANVAKDQFIAVVSHELRSPLSAMLGWAQMLQEEEPGSPMYVRGLETIERNARAQSQLIEDLLDVSRIAVGKLEIQPVPVSVPTLITAALDSARPAVLAKGLTLESRIDGDVGSLVADPDRLQQVIWNLVTNAVKFTPKGGVIDVTASREGSQIEIRVRDTGIGIADDFLPKVFERYHQAKQGSKKTGGLGLGLAIVRQIVVLHGGTVTAESEGLGKGAMFTVRLPIRAAFDDATPRHWNAAATSTPAPPVVLQGARLLVVDDERDARELLAVLLGRAGAVVRTAGSATEALEMIAAEVPDVLVSDIGMPVMDGYDLIRELRAKGAAEGGGIPAIALTAYSRSEDRTKALTAGFNAHIPKPVEPLELVIVLANALGRELGDLLG